MDRGELEERIRGRRAGGAFRRGSYAGADPRSAGYERYEPEPYDSTTRQVAEEEAAQPRIDRFSEPPPPPPPTWDEPLRHPEDRQRMRDEPADDGRRGYEDQPSPGEPPAYEQPAYGEEAYPYAYAGADYVEEEEERPSAIGPAVLIGFVVLGIVAVLGGALLAGIMTGPVAEASPTPTPDAAVSPSPTAAPTETAPPTTDPASPGPSPNGPFTFPDGFTAEAQPCAVQPVGDGQGGGSCPQDGSTIAQGTSQVWVLVNFDEYQPNDVIEIQVVNPGGSQVDQGSFVDSGSGRGWAYFGVATGRFEPGGYQVVITRNGTEAAETSFRIEA